MSRSQWIRQMLSEGKTEEEILSALEKGNEELGISSCEKRFVKLNYNKVVKAMNK